MRLGAGSIVDNVRRRRCGLEFELPFSAASVSLRSLWPEWHTTTSTYMYICLSQPARSFIFVNSNLELFHLLPAQASTEY